MKRKVIYIILLIWLAMILVDIICAFTISRPIFMLPVEGGEVTLYYGIGYTMKHYYEMTPDGYWDGGFFVNPLLYLFINGIVLFKLVTNKKRT